MVCFLNFEEMKEAVCSGLDSMIEVVESSTWVVDLMVDRSLTN